MRNFVPGCVGAADSDAEARLAATSNRHRKKGLQPRKEYKALNSADGNPRSDVANREGACTDPGRDRGKVRTARRTLNALSLRARLIELETKHLRLQRLVAELLIKNQKLRELLCERAGTSTAANFCRGDGAVQHWHASSH